MQTSDMVDTETAIKQVALTAPNPGTLVHVVASRVKYPIVPGFCAPVSLPEYDHRDSSSYAKEYNRLHVCDINTKDPVFGMLIATVQGLDDEFYNVIINGRPLWFRFLDVGLEPVA